MSITASKSGSDQGLQYFYRIIAAAALIWTATVAGSATWNVHNEHAQTLDLARKEALSNFNKDQAFRLWATKHGGVYVPPSGETPPNPYLSHIPDRDITLPSGKQLTLMNPAYMVRQLMADFNELYGIKGRITSLKPLNPDNAPDPWERQSLLAFAQGAEEFFAIVEEGGKKNLRLMRPMVTKAGCLKCHAHQGYREGDIRGGVGVVVPMAPYLLLEKKAVTAMILSHFGIWFLVCAFLGGVFFRGKRFIRAYSCSRAALAESEERLQRFFELASEGLIFHEEGRIVDANPSFLALLGYDHLEEVVGRSLYEFVSPAGQELVRERLAQEEAEPGEIDFLRRDGGLLPAEIGARAYPLAGWPLQVISVRNLSERKRAETQFRESHERLLTVLNSLEAVVYVADLETHEMLFINKYVENTFGDILGLPCWQGMQSGQSGPCPFCTNRYLLDDRGQPAGVHHWEHLNTCDGHWYDIRDRAILWIDGRIVRLEIAIDISQRKEMEERLRQLNSELEERVVARTAELAAKNSELERLNRLFVGRELAMIELKGRVKALEEKPRRGAGDEHG